MKRNLLSFSMSLLVCAAIVAGGQFFAGAQDAQQAASKPQNATALIDVERIFKEHKGFQESTKKMKAEVAAVEVEIRDEGSKLLELVEEAKALKVGDPLRRKLEVEVTQRQADLLLKMNLQKQDFVKREGVMYAQVNNEIEVAVAAYCHNHGITLVLRNKRHQVDEHSETDMIRAAVNRPVIFQDGLDITDEILNRLNTVAEGGDL